MKETNSASPLITLWYKPGQTLQDLMAKGRGRREAIIVTILFGLVNVWPAYAASEMRSWWVLLVAGSVAVLGLFLFSWLLRNFSRWFGASPVLPDVRLALGWGLLPWAVCLGLLLLGLSVTGADPRQLFPLFFAALVYGFIILLSAVSVALRLPLMKSFFCLILTFLVSIFPLTFIFQLIGF